MIQLTATDVTQVGWLVSSPAAVAEEDEESGQDTSSHQANTQHGEVHLGEDHLSVAASESEEEVHGRHSSLVRGNSQVIVRAYCVIFTNSNIFMVTMIALRLLSMLEGSSLRR